MARAAPSPAEPAPWPLRPEDRPLFLKLSLLAYRNSGVFGQMVRDPGLPARLQAVADGFARTVPEKGEAEALEQLRQAIHVEHPVVRQATEDPVFWRILAIEPRFPSPARVAAALRWYGGTPAAVAG